MEICWIFWVIVAIFSPYLGTVSIWNKVDYRINHWEELQGLGKFRNFYSCDQGYYDSNLNLVLRKKNEFVLFLDYNLIDQDEEEKNIQPRNLAEGNNFLTTSL